MVSPINWLDHDNSIRASLLLDQALELSSAQQDTWLRELGSTDPDLAWDIRRLLAARASERFASFMAEPITPSPSPMAYALPGELIGSYRIVRELGQGGMAVVYLAERADGQYSQQVALKILRLGPAGGRVQFHFAQERQILASLDHPSIARLIDAGTAAMGLPYLAMEYVEGTPIDRYCDEQRLTLDERLRLFLQVADAVQYAHRHLIVHRDLKPSNIVVTNEGHVKLLDFGIAKLLAPAAFEHAAPPTRDGARLLTPEYASPEQVLGKPVTTATDIYQLGLLLYGLLTGREPYDLRGREPLEAFRVICEFEPLPPSAAINNPAAGNATQGRSAAAISTARAAKSDRLRRALRGELDAILLKALRKEPERRYTSVGWLIDDIHRYQHGLPVSAYEGVWAYRAAKFLRRHAKVLAVAGIAILAVALITAWYTVQLSGERNRAQREAASAEQVVGFLASVFRGSNARLADSNITARELLDRGAARIETELAGQPAIKARLLNVIGDAYVQYDLQEKAQSLLERALQLNTQVFGRNSEEAAESQQALAKVARNRGDLQEAKNLYEEVLRVRERTLGPRHPETAATLRELAFTFYRLGEAQPAIRAAERAIDIYTHSAGADDESILHAMHVLAVSTVEAGEPLRARAYFEQLLPRIEHSLGTEHHLFVSALASLAVSKASLGEYDGAEQQLRRCIDIYERIYGPNHGDITLRRINLGVLYFYTGRLDESIAMFQHAIATQRKVSGPGHRFEGHAQWGIGLALRSRGELQEALNHLQLALAIFRKTIGASHGNYAEVLQAYGETQLEMGNLAAARLALREAMSITRRNRLEDHYDVAIARVANALLLMRTGKSADAEREIRAAISRYEAVLPPGHRLLAAARSALGEALLAQGKIVAAEPLLESGAQQLRSSLHYERRLALQRLIQLYELQGKLTSVRQYQDELAAFERKVRSQ